MVRFGEIERGLLIPDGRASTTTSPPTTHGTAVAEYIASILWYALSIHGTTRSNPKRISNTAKKETQSRTRCNHRHPTMTQGGIELKAYVGSCEPCHQPRPHRPTPVSSLWEHLYRRARHHGLDLPASKTPATYRSHRSLAIWITGGRMQVAHVGVRGMGDG